MAQKVCSSSRNRIELPGAVPLKAPLAVHIFPSYHCNFRCSYCVHSLEDKEFSKLFTKQLMTMDTFIKAVQGIERFDGKLKLLNFAGHGEPLLNKLLPKMIQYAVQRGITEKTEVVTNAYCLTQSMSEELVAAGLDSIRISIQGLTAGKYKEVSGADIDFDRLLRQIEYFYKNKGQCSVYIKIIDYALKDEEEEKRYYELFSGICDYIAVEHLVPTASGVDYEQFGMEYNQTQQGFPHKKIDVCPMPFYMMIVEPDGNVRNCCATRYPILLGNVNDSSLFDIWQSNMLRNFWLMQLDEGRNANPVCGICNIPDYGVQPGDILDPHRQMLSEKIKTMFWRSE